MQNPSATDYYSGKTPWIRDKKRFRLAMIVTAVLVVLSIKYPGTRPLYEEALLAIRLPISIPFPGGGNLIYPGLIFTGLCLWALYLIWESLNRHRLLISVALLWLTPTLGNAVLAGYQMVIPANVYALTVDQDQANCVYQFDQNNMTGSCTIVLKNRSNREITVEQTGKIVMGSGTNREEANFSLGSVTIGPRQAVHNAPTFVTETPSSVASPLTGSEATGSGYTSLSADGFVLEMNDGEHTRTWGR